MSTILNGLEEVPIGDFCQTGSGGTPSRSKASRYFGGSIPWVKSGELRETVITETEECITKEGLEESAAKLLPVNTLLVALYGATVGRIGVLGVEAATNQAVCYIIPDERRADRKYLYYALQSKVPAWLSQRVGGGQPNISQGIIKDTKIPLPPLSEQKRIADILDKADTIRRKRRVALQSFDSLSAALFDNMFRKKLSSANWTNLEDYLIELRYGTSNKSGTRGYLALRIPNIVRGIIDINDLKSVSVSENELKNLRLIDGDILFVRTNGNPDYVGRCAIFYGNHFQNHGLSPDDVIYASYLIRARLDMHRLRPTFLQALLQTSAGRKDVRDKCRTSAGQYNINTKGISALRIPTIDIEEQLDFEERLKSLQPTYLTLTNAEQHADDLFNSLVQRVFNGEM
jgi:type I restriction enzyme S subunit